MSKYNYLIEKIENARFSSEPFKHIYIEDFFNTSDFKEIVASNQIDIVGAKSDRDLHNKLTAADYGIISFPGTSSDFNEYEKWHQKKSASNKVSDVTSSFGIVYRLNEPEAVLQEIFDFLSSEKFNNVLAHKFGLNAQDLIADNGIQKYLDGYEISPHPDIRRKALTFMVNINPRQGQQNYHTHYLKFKPEWEYIESYWKHNSDSDRCWVPWNWCETVKQQTNNNSIVIFSPSHDTMHAVKADYDHLNSQRTQLYGNLWYRSSNIKLKPEWSDYVIKASSTMSKSLSTGKIKDKLKRRLFGSATLKRNID